MYGNIKLEWECEMYGDVWDNDGDDDDDDADADDG